MKTHKFVSKNVVGIMVLFMLGWCESCKHQTSSEHFQNEQDSLSMWESKGKEVVLQSQAAILQRLSQVIGQEGSEKAVQYCNLNVHSIIDSLQKTYHCSIRRTSLKLRNPANQPQNDDEIKTLQQFYEAHQQKQGLKPKVVQNQNITTYFHPILMVMETCLKCHGQPNKDIEPQTYKTIQKLYPSDLATDYQLNDFRGMWVISFEQPNEAQ